MSDSMLIVLYFNAILFGLASCLAMFRFYYWLGDNQIHRRNRARTCGTCAYCEYGEANAHGLCCRHVYTTRINFVTDEPKRTSIVRLDWRGCGESEERT